jgi:CyaY protein
MRRGSRPAGLGRKPVVCGGSRLARDSGGSAGIDGDLAVHCEQVEASRHRSHRYSVVSSWSLFFAIVRARPYLAALEPDQTFFEVAAMSLSEARFHDLVDETQEKLEDIFDESDLDIDLESSAGVLTVKFENGTQLIFSRQEPLRQLWLAAVSGGFHFDYDEESERWMCDKSEEQLGEMLERIVKQQAGVEFDFEGL